jgi:glycosyltransferase involved in cell wall biosynthesis
MDLSVGLIAFNEEKNIARLLRSLLEQTKKAKEIIVVSSGIFGRTNEIGGELAENNRAILFDKEKRLLNTYNVLGIN